MMDRDGFEALQNRWARGDALGAEEDEARRTYALSDPVAERELEVFRELRAHMNTADGAEPNVAAALARLRGVHLRVVAPGDGVRERPRRRRTPARLAGASVGLLTVAAATFIGTRPAPAPAPVARIPPPPIAARTAAAPAAAPSLTRSELVFASGDVAVNGRRAEIGRATLSETDTVVTRDGRACFSIDPGVDVCLARDTEIVLDALNAERLHVRVRRGTAIAALSPRDAGQSFALVSSDLSATAHGTVFALEANSGRAVNVTVLEGSVAVERPGATSELVLAHSSLTLSNDGAKRELTGRGDEARLLDWLTPKELARGSNLGVLEIPAHGSSRVIIDDRGPYGLPLQAFVSAGRHRVVMRPAAGADTLSVADVEAGATRRVLADDPRRDALSKAAPSNEGSATSAKALLDEARERMARGDAQGARAAYERVRALYPTSAEAHTVLVWLGRLELQAGAAERALASFDAYGRKGGALAPEAMVGRIRALRALGRRGEERRAIEGYLASYPKSLEAPALENRLATLAR